MVATNDQILIAAEKLKIASGDINSVIFVAEFDATWDEFVNRSASFYTSHNSNPIDSLMVENECVVPAEVLANPGTLYAGIVGVTADGQRIKTTNYVGFKIIKGAEHSHTTVAPELNLYQQYLSAVMNAVSPAHEVLLARLEERIKEHEVEIAEEYARFKGALVEMIQPVTVWENNELNDYKWHSPSETNTVNVDLSNYSSFLVVFYEKSYQSSGGVHTVYSPLVGSPMIVEKGTRHQMEIRDGNNGIVTRGFTLTDEGAVFEPPTIGWTLIPAKIIGFGV